MMWRALWVKCHDVHHGLRPCPSLKLGEPAAGAFGPRRAVHNGLSII